MVINHIESGWRWSKNHLGLLLANIFGFLRIRYHWLILLLFAFALIGFFLLQWFGPDASASTNAYLLSAIAQSIAALFAVVFTITVIVLQVGYRFRGVLTEFLRDPFNLVYPLLSSIGIVLPLIILRIERYGTWSNVAVALAGFCVFLVAIFFLRMKDFLTYNVGVREIMKQSREALERHDALQYNALLWRVVRLSDDAVVQKKYIVVEEIIHGLLDLGMRAHDIEESLAFSSDIHMRQAFHGIASETFKKLCIYLQLAADIGVLKRVGSSIVSLSRLPDYMPNMNKDTFKTIAASLVYIAKSAKEDAMKKVACCAVWIFSAKWPPVNKERIDAITQIIKEFATSVGKELALSCNDEQGLHSIYENAAWALRSTDKEAYRRLGTLRSIVERL